MAESSKFNIFTAPKFDNSLVSLHEISHKPYGAPGYKPTDEIRIPINFQDLLLDISRSYIYVEGKFKNKDDTKPCYLSNNSLAFLFDELRYVVGGEIVATVRKPGITSAIKLLVSGTPNHPSLSASGWGLGSKDQGILDRGSGVFSGKLPLSYLTGFAEDYRKAIVNVPHELILVIARSFKDCYDSEHAGAEADISITRIEWKIKHMVPEDEQKLQLFTRIAAQPVVEMAFRSWDLFELPSLRQTKEDIWSVKTSTNLEKPRYILIAFQDAKKNDKHAPINFSHVNITNIRAYLNSIVYPYERWNLDFSQNLYGPAYYAYTDFQNSYYSREAHECAPLLNYNEFKDLPVFVIDCTYQPEAVKSSTVDLKIEFQTTKDFPTTTRVYALVLHDSLIKYNPISGSVQKVINQ